MKLRLLFTIFVVLLGGVLTYQKAPPEVSRDGQESRVGEETTRTGVALIYQKALREVSRDGQESKAEEETVQEDNLAAKEDLVHQELPSLPKAPETKPIEPKKEVSVPGPLKAVSPPASTPASEPTPPSAGGLTRSGVISQTNLQRQGNSLGFLSESVVLDVMAEKKAGDMCEKQYFAHTSPAGIGAASLADSFDYDYIVIGENLALGPFGSDEAVVEAWMGSPGHRANILNFRFTEIGVGVTECAFEGRPVWLAVQHFGKPASDCPQADAALRKTIDEKKAALAEMKERLAILRSEIEASDPEADPDYNTKVGNYNLLVREYNSLIAETKTLIDEYNGQAAAFNTCASS